MWAYAILGLLFFSVFYSYYEIKQRHVFRKYSKKIILSNIEILSENFIFENGQSSTNIYLLDKKEKILKAKTTDAKDIMLKDLNFSDFQIFKTYIEKAKPNIKIFTHVKTMYLFYPVLNKYNSFEFVVFSRNKVVFDDIMGFKTKRYNY